MALGDPDQALEDAGDGERQLLRACPALRLQPLGERGEAGEVDGDQRSLDLAYTEPAVPAPVQYEPGEIRGEGRHLLILVPDLTLETCKRPLESCTKRSYCESAVLRGARNGGSFGEFFAAAVGIGCSHWCRAWHARRGIGARRRATTPALATSSTLTVDGVLDEPAWDTTSYGVVFGSLGTATVRFLPHEDDLYVGVVVADATRPGRTPLLRRLLRQQPRRRQGARRRRLALLRRRRGQDFFWRPGRPEPAARATTRTRGAGADQTTAAGTISGGNVIFEIRHPLCTERVPRHLRSSAGPDLGVDFQYQRGLRRRLRQALPGSTPSIPSRTGPT